MMSTEHALVALYEQVGALHGKVKPLLRISSTGDYELLEGQLANERFPNPGLIFVLNRFNDLMEKVGFGDLFLIDYLVNYKYQEEDPDNCKFNLDYRDILYRERDEFKFIDIVEISVFDPNKLTQTGSRIRPGRYVMLHEISTDYVYGPLLCNSVESADGRMSSRHIEYNLSFDCVKNIRDISEDLDHVVCRFEYRSIPEHLVLDVSVEETYGNRKLLSSWKALIDSVSYELIDMMKDESLVRWFKSLPGESKVSRTQLQEFNKQLSEYKGQGSFGIKRKERLINLVQAMSSDYSDIRNQIIQEYISSDVGKEYLEEYVSKHKDQLLKEMLQKMEEELQFKAGELDVEINDKQTKLIEIEKEIGLKEDEIRKKSLADIQAEIDDIEKEHAHKLKELGELKEKHGLAIEIDELKLERDMVRGEKRGVERELEKLTKERNALKMDIENEYLKIRRIVHEINNDVPVNDHGSVDYSHVYISQSRQYHASAKEYVKEISEYFSHQSRNISNDMLANLLVSIQQNYITVLAGLSGVGKTSTVSLLAESMGLKGSTDTTRFLEIPVARGWSSIRDFIGYYNPLNQMFEPANTGMFDVVRTIHSEAAAYKEHAPFWVMLDEANLSPIEHYWSNFLSIADDRNKEIRLGKQNYQLSNAVRFIATVNFDNTTETLSDRLLDRANIVFIDAPESLIDSVDIADVVGKELPLPISILDQFFGISLGAELTVNEEKLFRQIVDILKNPDKGGRPVAISPRTQQAVVNYCAKARDLMTPGNPMLALDYAVSQRVLPRLSGYDSFESRLDELRLCIRDDLRITNKLIENMLKCGRSEHGYYRFFC